MAKKIFISYDYDHDRHYKNMLLAWDENSEFDFGFSDYSADVAINSTDEAVIKRAISAKISAATYFLCLVGTYTHNSDWVDWEIEKAIDLKKRLVAVKTTSTNSTPQRLIGAGASWAMSFTFDSIKKAIEGA